IVESGAKDYIVSQSDNNRSFSLGDPTGNGESYFEVNEDFKINRTAGGALMGTVNIDVADGKTFTFASNAQIAKVWNSVSGGTGLPTVNTAGGALKFHGAGQLAVPTLTATGSTLDYSDLAAARATPFVSGALAVDGDTVFKFPASAAFPYPVATSVSSTASGDVTFHVGSSAYTRELWFSGGYLCPERRATFAGGGTAIDWSSLVWDISYADETRAFSRVTASASGTLALGAVTNGKVILEVPQGVELTLTGTLAASEIVVTGAGTVICSAANTLQGTVTGDATVTVVYSTLPTTGTGGATFTDTGWQGVLWLKNATVNNFDARNLGSANSVLRFTGCTGFAYAQSDEKSYECSCTIDLQDDGETKALTLSNGYGGWRAIYKALTGTGTLYSNTATSHYYIFKDASAFAGTVSLDTAALTHVVLGNATATDTTAGSVYVASGAAATVATGKTWTAPGGFAVNGTLAVVGTGAVSGDLSLASGATLDLAAYTGSQAVSGELTPSAGLTLLLPSGATLPYQVAASGDAVLAHFTYQIGSDAAVTGPVVFDDGALSDGGVKTATLEGMGGVAIGTLFGNGAIEWTGSGNHYVLTLTAANSLLTVGDTTGVESLTIIVQNDGALYVSGELPENTVVEGLGALTVAENATQGFYQGYTRLYSQIGTTATGNGAISTSGTTISAGGALVQAPLAAGNYTLARWLSPQKLSTGYGYAANVSTTVADGCAYKLVYMADRIVLRVYDTAAQNARGTLKIWPYGDSITEGFNSSDTTANYRVLLAQKLSLLGYNVEMVGCYDKVQSRTGTTTFYDAKDPSGQTVLDEWKWHSGKHGAPVMPGISGLPGRGALLENVDTLCAQVGNPDVVLLHIGVNDLSQSSDTAGIFAAWTNTVWRILNNLPDTKVVVSTIMYRNAAASDSLNTKITALNGYINTQMSSAAELPFPSGRVLLAD
ncbi:MAG: SGNH/GDSL hydrolase family protein, partial [Kiritimatiellae bacterium]|nr:SGNH/GDSL hydrolase family protein [Kiritimatiellia bacterium]